MNGEEIRERLLGIEEIAAIAQHCGITSESTSNEIDSFFCQMAEVSQCKMELGSCGTSFTGIQKCAQHAAMS